MDLTTVSTRSDDDTNLPRRATMREVAALAGVSLKTVSRVVNGEPGVRESVRVQVETAVARLDYRHHSFETRCKTVPKAPK